MNTKLLKYSVVIPVHNEAENLSILARSLTETMQQLPAEYEIIFVDDGSTDTSREIIRRLCKEDAHIRGLVFDKNHGQTAAFDAGFKAARGQFIITMDADLQYDPQDIPKLLAWMDEFDVVCGYREQREDNWLRRISSRIANAIRNLVTQEKIRDIGCSLRVMRRECVQNLKLFEGMHRFLPTLIRMQGYSISEVPVRHFLRRFGTSKYTARNRVFKALKDLLAVRWMQNRLLRYKIEQEFGKSTESKFDNPILMRNSVS